MAMVAQGDVYVHKDHGRGSASQRQDFIGDVPTMRVMIGAQAPSRPPQYRANSAIVIISYWMKKHQVLR